MAAILLASALVMSTPAAACSSCGGMGDAAEGQDAMRHGGDMASGGGMMKRSIGLMPLLLPGSATDKQLRRIADYLDQSLQLDVQQGQKAWQALERYIKITQKERATLRHNRGRLLEMITAGETMDKEALQQLAQENARATGRVMHFWALTMQPIYQILNETQREHLAKMRGHIILGANSPAKIVGNFEADSPAKIKGNLEGNSPANLEGNLGDGPRRHEIVDLGDGPRRLEIAGLGDGPRRNLEVNLEDDPRINLEINLEDDPRINLEINLEDDPRINLEINLEDDPPINLEGNLGDAP